MIRQDKLEHLICHPYTSIILYISIPAAQEYSDLGLMHYWDYFYYILFYYIYTCVCVYLHMYRSPKGICTHTHTYISITPGIHLESTSLRYASPPQTSLFVCPCCYTQLATLLPIWKVLCEGQSWHISASYWSNIRMHFHAIHINTLPQTYVALYLPHTLGIGHTGHVNWQQSLYLGCLTLSITKSIVKLLFLRNLHAAIGCSWHLEFSQWSALEWRKCLFFLLLNYSSNSEWKLFF